MAAPVFPSSKGRMLKRRRGSGSCGSVTALALLPIVAGYLAKLSHLQVLLNDLDISAQYTERLVEDMSSSDALSQSFLSSETAQVWEELARFGELSTRMRGIVRVRRSIRAVEDGALILWFDSWASISCSIN